MSDWIDRLERAVNAMTAQRDEWKTRALKAEEALKQWEWDLAEAGALVMSHEGHIAKLEAEVARLRAESAEAFADFLTTEGALIDYGGLGREPIEDALKRFRGSDFDQMKRERDEAREQASDYALQDGARAARIAELEAEVARLSGRLGEIWKYAVKHDDHEGVSDHMMSLTEEWATYAALAGEVPEETTGCVAAQGRES